MGMISKLVIKESQEELRLLAKHQSLAKNRDRILALMHIKGNTFATRDLLCQHLGYSKRSLERWLTTYRKTGLKSMLLPNERERKSYLIPDEVDDALAKRVNDSESGFSSYKEAQQWVFSEYGLELKYNTIREHLIRYYKTKIKSPRKSYTKKDEQAVEAFLKTA